MKENNLVVLRDVRWCLGIKQNGKYQVIPFIYNADETKIKDLNDGKVYEIGTKDMESEKYADVKDILSEKYTMKSRSVIISLGNVKDDKKVSKFGIQVICKKLARENEKEDFNQHRLYKKSLKEKQKEKKLETFSEQTRDF